MAYQKYRIRRKAADGYDIMHIESRTDMVLRFDESGNQLGTAESAIAELESTVGTLESGLSTANTNITKKADKVSGATSGNFAGLDANGNLTDSGKKAGDFATAGHDHSGVYSEEGHAHAAGDITSGTFTAARIPSLAASKITSGNFSVARGGTGLTSLTDGYFMVGNGTDAIEMMAPATVLTTIGAATSGHNHDGVYAPLSSGKIPSSYLPSFVDDVIEGTYDSATSFKDTSGAAVTGESGKIYVDTTSNKTYRWSGSAFVEISASLALGETSATAYRGDRGKVAYDHSQATHARTDATATAASSTNGNIKINGSEVTVYTHPAYTAKSSGFYKITVDATGHVSAVTAVTKADITGLGIPAQDTTYTHPSHTAYDSGLYKITVNSLGHVTAATAVTAADIKALSGIAMTGATSSAAGAAGLVPAPAAGKQLSFLRGDGTWVVPTNTDTKVTAVGNHYTPAADSSAALSVDASSSTAATWGSTALVTGVNIQRDAAGHVTGVTVDSIRMPANPNSDLKAASGDTSSKIFLIGATSQSTSGQTTYSNSGVYAQSDRIYSNSRMVIDVQYGTTQPTNQAEGDLWFETVS